MRSIHTTNQQDYKNNTPYRVIHKHRTKLGNPIWGIILSSASIITLSSILLASTNVAHAESSGGSVSLSVDNSDVVLELTVPSSATLNLAPSSTNNYIAFGTTDVTVSAGTNNSAGYLLTMSVPNTSLVNSGITLTSSNNPNNIPLDNSNHPTIPTLASGTTYTESTFTTNTWGYKLPTSESYSSIPSTLELANTSEAGNATNTTLNFAAKIDSSQPAGTYTTTLNFTAVINVVLTGLESIDTMQEMTPKTCAETPTPLASDGANTPQYQLKDTRDNKLYWVAKLADGNCWMTQNLDLGGNTRIELTANDTDLTTGTTFILPKHGDTSYPTSLLSFEQKNGAISNALTTLGLVNNAYARPTETDQYLHDLGEQYIVGSNIYYSLSTCTSAGNTKERCEHNHIGNMYSWGTATALGDSASSITDSFVSSSICPKGWHLPTGSSGGQFQVLNNAYGGSTSTDSTLLASPLFFIRSGYADSGGGSYWDISTSGWYWSSISYNYLDAYGLYFNSSRIEPSHYDSNSKLSGRTIRCVSNP